MTEYQIEYIYVEAIVDHDWISLSKKTASFFKLFLKVNFSLQKYTYLRYIQPIFDDNSSIFLDISILDLQSSDIKNKANTIRFQILSHFYSSFNISKSCYDDIFAIIH